MGDEPEFSQDGVLNFLVESGGRAANTELLHRFRGALSEPSARDLFKSFVNAVGLVKQEDGTKYVVLKKKYKHLVKATTDADNGLLRAESRDDGTPSEQPAGTPSEQPAGATTPVKQQQQGVSPNKQGEMTRIIALPSRVSVDEERGGAEEGDTGSGGGGDASSGGEGGDEVSSTPAAPPPVAIGITVPSPAVAATGDPFAEGGLATRAAPADEAPADASSKGRAVWTTGQDEETGPGSRSEAAASAEPESSGGARDAGESERGDGGEEVCPDESGTGDQDGLSRESSSGATAAAAAAVVVGGGGGTGVGKASVKTAKKNLSHGLRVPGSPQTKRRNSSSSSSSPKSPFVAPNFGGGGKSSAGDSDTESVGSARTSEDDGGGGGVFGSAPLALEPVEHEWIVSAARGDWGNLHALLLSEPSLALRRDPLTGYTALHWAAKHGKADVVPVLLAAAESAAGLSESAGDVNVRSHGGYTALHLAAMHSRADVAKMLVGAYEADVGARDHGGRKPWHYLGRDAPWEMRELLEAPALDAAERPEAEAAAARGKMPRSYLGSLRIPAHGGAGSDDEGDAGGAASNFLRDMQLMRRQSFARLLKAPMNKKRHKTQIIHSSSAVRETRPKEEGDLPLGKVAL